MHRYGQIHPKFGLFLGKLMMLWLTKYAFHLVGFRGSYKVFIGDIVETHVEIHM